jgi:DNA-binding transcriptional regulator YhcF (GntR family)
MTRTPTISVNLKSTEPVYRQIVDALRRLLVEGAFAPGDQLPPVRQLALDLAVHFNTVAQAYRVLSEEGWLDLKRRRGAIVLDRTQPGKPSTTERKQALRKLQELTAQLRAAGIPGREIAHNLRALADGIEET